MIVNCEYLSDGAYVGQSDLDGNVAVYTSDGRNVKNKVELDATAIECMLNYLKKNGYIKGFEMNWRSEL